MICDEINVAAGAIMYREGDKADKLYILTDDEVDIQYTLGSGELRTVDTVVPGELLMLSALVEPFKSTAVVAVRAPSKLIAIDAEKLRAFCAENLQVANEVLLRMTKMLATRLEGARIQLATVD